MKSEFEDAFKDHIPWIRARSSVMGLVLLVVGAVLVAFSIYGMDGHLFTVGFLVLVGREVLYTQTLVWRLMDLIANKKTDSVTGRYVADD
jgi:hypothetical protein